MEGTMNLIAAYIEYIQEANRIVQGLSRSTGKPKEHIDKIWKDTEKEMLVKHKYGVTDKYRQIGNVVRSKLGVAPDPKEDNKEEDGDEKKSPEQ
jgi:hypothetical protein